MEYRECLDGGGGGGGTKYGVDIYTKEYSSCYFQRLLMLDYF